MTKTLRVILNQTILTDYMSDWVKLTHQAVQYIASSEFDAILSGKRKYHYDSN